MATHKNKQKKSKQSLSQKINSFLAAHTKTSLYLGVFAIVISLLAVVGAFAMLLSSNQDSAQAGVICPAGYTWNGTACTSTNTTSRVCPSGGVLQGDGSCVYSNLVCPSNYTLINQTCKSDTQLNANTLHVSQCESGASVITRISANNNTAQTNECDPGRTETERQTLDLQNNRYIVFGFCEATNLNNVITRFGVGNQPNLPNPCAGDPIRNPIPQSGEQPAVRDMWENQYLHRSYCQSVSNTNNIITRVFADNDPNPRNSCDNPSVRIQIEQPAVFPIGWVNIPATNPAPTTSTCPSGFSPSSATMCSQTLTQSPTGYEVDSPSVGTGNCTPATLNAGTTTTCTFPLTGSPTGTYSLPSQGLFVNVRNDAATPTSSAGDSDACTVINNTTLSCTNVPTTGLTDGEKTVVIHQPGVTYFDDKGSVTIQNRIVITTTNINDALESFSCTPNDTTVNQTTVCSGEFRDEYVFVGDPIPEAADDEEYLYVRVLGTDVSIAISDLTNCVVDEAANSFVCSAAPVGSQIGTFDVGLTITTPFLPGDLADSQFAVTDEDITVGQNNQDSDGDGIPDRIECPTLFTDPAACVDTDGDGTPDYQDNDSDGDGIPDEIERGATCATPATCVPVDTDGDGTPDYRDGDSDGDTIPDSVERGTTCATLATCVPVDTDSDGTPDYRDTDSDNDGIPDRYEASCSVRTSLFMINTSAQSLVNSPCDTDSDGTPDYRDTDSDNDGLSDTVERGSTCQSLANCVPVDSDNNGIPDFRQPLATTTVRSGGIAAFASALGITMLAGVGYGVYYTRKNKGFKVG